jgi:predicted ATPase
VRDAIGTRLNSLSALCNETLTIASVMGAKFDFRPLLALSRVSQDRLLEALEEALAEGIIE